jgi:hypothetical protein
MRAAQCHVENFSNRGAKRPREDLPFTRPLPELPLHP